MILTANPKSRGLGPHVVRLGVAALILCVATAVTDARGGGNFFAVDNSSSSQSYEEDGERSSAPSAALVQFVLVILPSLLLVYLYRNRRHARAERHRLDRRAPEQSFDPNFGAESVAIDVAIRNAQNRMQQIPPSTQSSALTSSAKSEFEGAQAVTAQIKQSRSIAKPLVPGGRTTFGRKPA